SSRFSRDRRSTSRASKAPGSGWRSPRNTWRPMMGISRWWRLPKAHTSAPRSRSRARSARRPANAVLLLALGLLTSGCQSNQPAAEGTERTAIAAPNASRLLELVRYGNRVRAGIDTDLSGEYRRLSFGDARWSDDAAIRLALLLSAPNTPYHDVDQAARILRDVVDRVPLRDNENTALATLLLHLLSERVYAASEDEGLANRLSEARDRTEQLTEELAAVRAELDEERERRQSLEEQLDALKRLEEQLSLEAF